MVRSEKIDELLYSDAQTRKEKQKERENQRRHEKENSKETEAYKANKKSMQLIFNKFDRDLNDVLLEMALNIESYIAEDRF